jgi:hypothetical protein
MKGGKEEGPQKPVEEFDSIVLAKYSTVHYSTAQHSTVQ